MNKLALGGARRRAEQANCTPVPDWVRQLRGIRAGRCTSEDAAGDIAEIGLPFPTLLAVVAGLVEIVCGSFLALGGWTEWPAAGLLLFLIPVTVLMENPPRADADFGAIIDSLENLAIMEGLLLVSLMGGLLLVSLAEGRKVRITVQGNPA